MFVHINLLDGCFITVMQKKKHACHVYKKDFCSHIKNMFLKMNLNNHAKSDSIKLFFNK